MTLEDKLYIAATCVVSAVIVVLLVGYMYLYSLHPEKFVSG